MTVLFLSNGKALTIGESEGFIKVLATPDKQKILGVHILGAHASDLIHEIAIAMKGLFTVDEVANTMHGHPTLSEHVIKAFTEILHK